MKKENTHTYAYHWSLIEICSSPRRKGQTDERVLIEMFCLEPYKSGAGPKIATITVVVVVVWRIEG